MGKLAFEYLEDQNLLKNTISNDLSVLIGTDRFSYLVADAQQNVLALKSFQFEINDSPEPSLHHDVSNICRIDALLTQPFRSTKIGLINPSNTIIPTALHDPKQNRQYLEELMTVDKKDIVDHYHLNSLEMTNVFAMTPALNTLLKGFFPEGKIMHSISPLVLAFQKLATVSGGWQVFLNISGDQVQVFVFENGQLKLNNTYTFQTPEDFIYFVLLAFHQFELKPELIPVTLSGFVVEESKLYHILYRYIRLLKWVQVPDYYQLPTEVKANYPHFYFDLFSLKLCE